ncbi:MAG: hypothetical protein KGJ59_00545 [Bacteroidota bacterium]|nr:hypothetical protein [Bacteroidota bacterium]
MMTLCFKKSNLLTLVTWFFIATFFADFANLDDVLPGTSVSHPEEVGISEESGNAAINSEELQNAKSLIQLKLSLTPLHAARRHTIQIVDLDSPSLAADPALVDQSISILPVEQNVHCISHISALPLYLLHCEFLI